MTINNIDLNQKIEALRGDLYSRGNKASRFSKISYFSGTVLTVAFVAAIVLVFTLNNPLFVMGVLVTPFAFLLMRQGMFYSYRVEKYQEINQAFVNIENNTAFNSVFSQFTDQKSNELNIKIERIYDISRKQKAANLLREKDVLAAAQWDVEIARLIKTLKEIKEDKNLKEIREEDESSAKPIWEWKETL